MNKQEIDSKLVKVIRMSTHDEEDYDDEMVNKYNNKNIHYIFYIKK